MCRAAALGTTGEGREFALTAGGKNTRRRSFIHGAPLSLFWEEHLNPVTSESDSTTNRAADQRPKAGVCFKAVSIKGSGVVRGALQPPGC